MLDRPDCGVLGLSFGRDVGFLGVCMGVYGIFWDAGFFSHSLDFSLSLFGGSGVLSHGAGS